LNTLYKTCVLTWRVSPVTVADMLQRVAVLSGSLTLAALVVPLTAIGQVTQPRDSGSASSPVSAPTPLAPSVLPSAPIDDVSPADRYRSAGYRNGTFYIHSPDELFRMYIMGRVHSDWIDQFGPAASNARPGSGINDGFFLRRARLELGGEFYETWQWQLGAEFSSATAIDNAAAAQAQPACSVNGATGALDCSTVRETPVQAATVKPIPTDVFVNYGPSPWGNVEVGQFYLPYTLENRISDNTTPFLERSLAVRNVGAPLQRDIGAMFWGESPDRVLYYAAAIVNGDGPNRVNVDARYDFAGRVVVRPIARVTRSPSKWSQLGLSAKYGSRDPSAVGYDVAPLTTQDGYVFWKPTYTDSHNRLLHIIPSDDQWGVAADVFVPVGDFDFTGEVVDEVSFTREAVDGMQLSPFTERFGILRGYSFYAQAGWWVIGDHGIIGYPSYGRPIHVDLTVPQKAPKQGVQVLAKVEGLHLTYDGSARGGRLDGKTPNGDIDVTAIEVGANYWATSHLRVGVNYAYYAFPGVGRPLSELSSRVGVQF
ncbi:MAG: porin, partial [Polyangiaceae bacterium]